MIVINKVKEPYGFFGNMSPHPIVYNGKTYRTSEALFQSLRFDDENIKEQIRAEKSPMGAKFVAKRYKQSMSITPLEEKDINNMRLCLKLKIEQHPDIKAELIKTGDEVIVENCTKRQRGTGLFWGAAIVDGTLEGENKLGNLWMELRDLIKISHNYFQEKFGL